MVDQSRERAPAGRPRLRHLEPRRVTHEGRTGLLLTDPLGISEPFFVPAGLVPLVARLDGTRTVEQLQRDVESGTPGIAAGFVARLVTDLTERLALESELVERRLLAEVEALAARGSRPTRHAGSAGYPADPRELAKELGRFVPRAARGRRLLRGLIAPHIDLARGERGYAAAYSALADSEPADLYVVFGTGHKGPSSPVTGLALDWDTPLGRVTTDRGFVARIHAELGTPPARDVVLHRHEHSLEFQVLMLRWVLGDRPFRVAGFMTGSLPPTADDPGEDAWVQVLLGAFRGAAAASGQRVCWVAGADLAHLGPWFGDADPIDAGLLARLDERERARLSHLGRGDAGAFVRSVEAGANPDRVCGTIPIFLTAELAGGPAELLHYGQAAAEDGSQVVSFCAAAF
jgi:AmmeMemoRadiSam system protein B